MSDVEDQGADVGPVEPMGTALELLDSAGANARASGAPVQLVQGVFSIYATPKGGLVLVTEIDGKVHRKKIPGPLLKMLARGPIGRALTKGGTDDGLDERSDG